MKVTDQHHNLVRVFITPRKIDLTHTDIETGTIQDTILCTNVKVKKGCNIKDSQIGADFEVPEKSKIVSEVRSCKAFCMPGDLPASPVLSALN